MVTHGVGGVSGVGSDGGLLRRAADWRLAEGRERETVATGIPSLDRLLPAGGVRRGSLTEWLAVGAAGDAGGAISLVCAVACRLATSSHQASTIVVVDRGARLYPPALMPWLDALAGDTALTRVIKPRSRPQLGVARPSRDDDEIWAIDQALRCPGVAAVLAWPGRVHATAMRRWQLAARTSGAVGLFVRGLSGRPVAGSPDAVRREPTWADVRVAISPVVGGESAAELSLRRLRLSLVGGPWSGDMPCEEPSTEVLLDMTCGRESIRRHRTPVWHGAKERFQPEGIACRAS